MRALLCSSVLVALLGGGCRQHSAPPTPPASASAGRFKPLSVVSSSGPHPVAPALRALYRSPVTLSVTETNLTLPFGYSTSMRTFSYESWAEWSFRRERVEAGAVGESGPECMREIKVTPVAWIAPLLGLREAIYESCPRQAHPGGETRLTTLAIDLERHAQGPPRPIVLTELFDAAVVSQALRADPIVVKAFGGSNIPTDLGTLVKALAETPPVVDGKHCYSFPEDLLARFVLHHSEGTHVAVRLGLPGAGPCRYELTELGLLLPMPDALKPALEHMGEDTGSFFLTDHPERAKTAIVHVTARAPN